MEYIAAVTLYAIVRAEALIGSLIGFVLFSSLVCGSVILYLKSTYQGLAYLLIYTGAVAVLFVLVLLLADSRQASLAMAYFPSFYLFWPTFSSASFLLVVISVLVEYIVVTYLVRRNTQLSLESSSALLVGLIYGDGTPVLSLVGGTLVTTTVSALSV